MVRISGAGASKCISMENHLYACNSLLPIKRSSRGTQGRMRKRTTPTQVFQLHTDLIEPLSLARSSLAMLAERSGGLSHN
jgi:hypothetical protein